MLGPRGLGTISYIADKGSYAVDVSLPFVHGCRSCLPT